MANQWGGPDHTVPRYNFDGETNQIVGWDPEPGYVAPKPPAGTAGWDRPYDPMSTGAGYSYYDSSGKEIGKFDGANWVHNNTLTPDIMRQLVGNERGPYGNSPQTLGFNNFTDQSYKNDQQMKSRDNDSALGALMNSGFMKVASLPFAVNGIQNGLSSMFGEDGPLQYTASTGEAAVSPDAWTKEMGDYLKTSTVDDTMGENIFEGIDWGMDGSGGTSNSLGNSIGNGIGGPTPDPYGFDLPGGADLNPGTLNNPMIVEQLKTLGVDPTAFGGVAQTINAMLSGALGQTGAQFAQKMLGGSSGSYSFPWGSAIGGGMEYLGQREKLQTLKDIEAANQKRWEATRATDESRYQTSLGRQDKFYNDDVTRYDAAVKEQNPFSPTDRQGFVNRYNDLTTNPQAGFLKQFEGPLRDVGEMAGRSSAAAGYNGTSRGYLNTAETMKNSALKDFYMPAVDDAWRAASWAPNQVARPGQPATIMGNNTTNYVTNPATAQGLGSGSAGPSGALGTMWENIARGNQPSTADQLFKGAKPNQTMSDWLFS